MAVKVLRQCELAVEMAIEGAAVDGGAADDVVDCRAGIGQLGEGLPPSLQQLVVAGALLQLLKFRRPALHHPPPCMPRGRPIFDGKCSTPHAVVPDVSRTSESMVPALPAQ